MAGQFGTFFGKSTFTAIASASQQLSVLKQKNGNDWMYFPAMQAVDKAQDAYCTLYRQDDASFRLRLPNLLWIGLMAETGTLILVSDFSAALPLKLAGAPLGQTWQALTSTGWQTVGYYADSGSPVLTVNLGPNASQSFVAAVITPDLDTVRHRFQADGVDFSDAELSGEDLSGCAFSQSTFFRADLRNVNFSQSNLSACNLQQCQINGINFQQTVLDQCDLSQAQFAGMSSWGIPSSAMGIILNQCQAPGFSIAGGQPLDCRGAQWQGAVLDTGDFRQVNLSGANLSHAHLTQCRFDSAIVDQATLSAVQAKGASFANASLKNVVADRANFVNVDFSNADLTQAHFGAKQYLFCLAPSLCNDLANAFVDQALMQAFAHNGINLSQRTTIHCVTPSKSWEIKDTSGTYSILFQANVLNVFLATEDLIAVQMAGTTCFNTVASQASMSGIDFSGVKWYGPKARLDHADLEGSNWEDSLLVEIDFTQAFLDNSHFSHCVLVQSKIAGCNITNMSLVNSQIQGCDMTSTTLQSCSLLGSGVAMSAGVPLFALPMSDSADLQSGNLNTIASTFANNGYPLGNQPSVTQANAWTIDNHQDTNPSAASSYQIHMVSGQLAVYSNSQFNFYLPEAMTQFLAQAHPTMPLIAAFQNAGYSVSALASISSSAGFFVITPASDAPIVNGYAYTSYAIYPQTTQLFVFGAGLLRLANWPQYAQGLAFDANSSLQATLNPACVGPSSDTYSAVLSQQIDWQSFLCA